MNITEFYAMRDKIIRTWLENPEDWKSQITEFLEYGLNECQDSELINLYNHNRKNGGY